MPVNGMDLQYSRVNLMDVLAVFDGSGRMTSPAPPSPQERGRMEWWSFKRYDYSM